MRAADSRIGLAGTACIGLEGAMAAKWKGGRLLVINSDWAPGTQMKPRHLELQAPGTVLLQMRDAPEKLL